MSLSVERTFSVAPHVDQVFSYFADFTRTEEWDPGTVSTTRISGDGGMGTRYRNRSRFLGRETELEYETVVHEPPSRFTCRGRNGTATATDHLTFTADGPHTTVHYRAVFQFHGLARLVAPVVVGPRLASLADETVARIQQVLGQP
jgi:carbon monoxide dehydrogenase subunit G